MSITSVGTPTLATGTTSPLTSTWGSGQNRTAGNLLIAAVTAGAATSVTNITASGSWALIGVRASQTQVQVAFFALTAAGGDAAPSFTSTLSGTARMSATLFEFTGANTATPLDTDATSGLTGTTANPLTVTTAANVAAAGEYAICVHSMFFGSSAHDTWTNDAAFTNVAVDNQISRLHSAVDIKSGPASGATLSCGGTWATAPTQVSAQIIVIAVAAASAAPFYPALSPARARIPQPWSKGRRYFNPGAPVQNPTAGPVFRQAVQPAQAKFPARLQNYAGNAQGYGLVYGSGTQSGSLENSFGSGRVQWSSGAPVRNPSRGPVFTQQAASQAVRARLPLQPLLRGRTSGNTGGPVANPVPGPVFVQRPKPVQAVLPPPHPRAGRTGSNPGAPIRNPVSGPVFAQKTWPVQATDPLPKHGRTYTTAKPAVTVVPPPAGPPFYPALQAVRARLPQQPVLRGRVSKNPPAPVTNPGPGPVFKQAPSPVRAQPGNRAGLTYTSASGSGAASAAAPAAGAPSIVQTTGQAPTSSGTISFTLSSSPTSGNVLIAFCSWNGNGKTISTPAGWTLIATAAGGGSGSDAISTFWRVVQPGDGTSWSFTVNGTADFTSGVLREISGASTKAPVNQYAAAVYTSAASTFATASVTPTVLNCLPLAGWTTDGPQTFSSLSAGWNEDLSEASNFHTTYSGHQTTATSDTSTAVTVTLTITGGTDVGASQILLIGPVEPPKPYIAQGTTVPAASQASAAFTLSTAPAAGNLLVAFVAYNAGSGTRTVSAPSGNWVSVDDTGGSSNDSLAVFYYKVQSGDPASWTFTVNTSAGNDFVSGILYEITGQASSPVNQHSAATYGGGTNPFTTNPVTPSVAGCLALAGLTTDASDTVSSLSAGWIQLFTAGGGFHASYGAHRRLLTTDTSTAISNSWTLNTTDAGSSDILLIAPAPSAPAASGRYLQWASGRISASYGAQVQNPAAGPVFTQKPYPARARVTLPSRGRVYTSAAAQAQASRTGPPFTPAPQAVRGRLALQPLLRGRVYGNAGAPVGNPSSGPRFTSPPSPLRARVPLFRAGRVSSSPGVTVRVPSAGPVFAQAAQPARARISQPFSKGRVVSNPGSAPRNPTAGPVFTQAVRPARARFPLPARGRAGSNPGGPVVLSVTGPVFRQAVQPARARVLQVAPRGRVYVSQSSPVRNPAPGPVFAQATAPARARIPQTFSKGRVYFNPGAPVRNPVPGPVFVQARQPIRVRIPQNAPRGRTSGNPGGPVFTSVTGPPFRQASQPARSRIPQNGPRGRVYGNPGGPVRNPHPGAAFPAPQGPVRVRLPLQPLLKGRASGNPGAPVQNPSAGPVFRPAVEALRARVPVPFLKGRVAGSPGAPVRNPSPGPAIPQAGQPVRARFPLPPKGRTGSNPGIPVLFVPPVTGPPFRARHDPARVRPSLPPRGRIASSPGAPVRNPGRGPVFTQAVRPARARVPQNAPRGRPGGNPGGPVQNVPFVPVQVTAGVPYIAWAAGSPYEAWSEGEPYLSWAAGTPYEAWSEGEPYISWAGGTPHT